ncbi:MAG: FkbM family methyltransferase [Azospirillaceae bacterium]
MSAQAPPSPGDRPGALAAAARRIATAAGLARSLVIYRAAPGTRRRLTRFYRALLPPEALVFDVGAHVGHRTGALRAAGARVVAIEPQPACLAVLARVFRRDPAVTVVPAALGAEAGEAVMRISRRHPTVSTLHADWIETVSADPGFGRVRWDAEARVPVETLGSLIARHGEPAYIKIDVEGGEAAVLAGLDRPVGLISFEALAAAPDAAAAALARIEALGAYRYNLVRGEADAFAYSDWVEAGELRRRLADERGHVDVFAKAAP